MPHTREAGTPCKLYVDGLQGVAPGHFIVSSGGSGYLVQAVRPSPSIAVRRYLTCIRVTVGEIPEGARVFELTWYRRDKPRRSRCAT